MNTDEFEKFRILNGMHDGIGTPIEISPHFFIIDVPIRSLSEEFVTHSTHQPRCDHTRTGGIDEERWEQTSLLLKSITSTYKDVIHVEVNDVYDEYGYCLW